jgi:hypothetical protein
VLAEHLRLGSYAVILSRTFHGAGSGEFERDIAALREAEALLRRRTPTQEQADAGRIAGIIRGIASQIPAPVAGNTARPVAPGNRT